MRFLLSINTVFPKTGNRVWYDDPRDVFGRGRYGGQIARQALSQFASDALAEVEWARSGHPENVRLPALVLKI